MPGRSSKGRVRHPLLAAAAYLLVPGERRRKAVGHFRKAGLETLRGVNSLARPERPSEKPPESRRQSISID